MENKWLIILPLVAGYLLDLLFGDPEKIPHPVKLFGYLIYKGEKLLNKSDRQFTKGIVLTVGLTVITFLFFYALSACMLLLSFWIYLALTSIFISFGLANKSLIQEGKGVFEALQSGIGSGRKQLSRIVGRDTSNLDEQQIRTAVFETMSENLSDGVIAPLFYYAIGGLPAMMTYKMINTLDSMIGYRNERYGQFGKFAARLDDVANFIPARLTALLMVAVTASKRGFQFVLRFGRNHKSPNSGYPEAALAGILNVRFGGPNVYYGVLVEKPFIGTNNRKIESNEITKVIIINHLTTLAMVIIIIAFTFATH